MNTCKSCEYYKYNRQYFEFRCAYHNHRIRDMDKYLDCESHKKKDGEENDSVES